MTKLLFSFSQIANNGDFPLYIIVSFPQYSNGPSFFPDKPTWVPLVPIESRCKFGCCSSKYFPLQLCYVKTIHTFQGQNAGPVSLGQLPNSIQRIICNPGDRSFKGKNPGLFYTISGRGSRRGSDVSYGTCHICWTTEAKIIN
jgi:hypothetical protein